MTNYDHIKAMSVEEVAKERIALCEDPEWPDTFDEYCGDFGSVSILDFPTAALAYEEAIRREIEWLQQEATE